MLNTGVTNDKENDVKCNIISPFIGIAAVPLHKSRFKEFFYYFYIKTMLGSY